MAEATAATSAVDGDEGALAAKVATFTRWPANAAPRRRAEIVLVVAPFTPLTDGFRACRLLLGSGRQVRLIGIGATLEREWPEWVRSEAGVSLSELGAYSFGTKAENTRPLRDGITRWLDLAFAGCIGGASGSRLMTGSAAQRVFQTHLDAYPLARGIARVHEGANISCTDPTWVGMELLSSLRGRGSGLRLPLKARTLAALWPASLVASAAALFPVAAVRTLREWHLAGPSLRAIDERRRKGLAPSSWLALVTDWSRINAHLVTTVGEELLARREERLGVVLVAGLRSGERSESSLRAKGVDLFSGLGRLSSQTEALALEQAVMPRTLFGVLDSIIEAAAASARATARTASHPRLLADGMSVDLRPHAWQIAKLCTVDVLRATRVAAATRQLVARYPFTGADVIFAANGQAETNAADLVMQGASATTYHLFHGTSGDDWVGGAEHPSTWHCAWTNADAQCQEALARPTLVAGMPRLSPRPPRPAVTAVRTRILLTTGYAHRDNRGRYRFEPYQDDLVSVLVALHARFGDAVDLRWRPHPADSDREIARTWATLPPGSVTLSRGAPLTDDAHWADVVVTNLSSVVSQFLLDDLPVFVHAQPDLWGTPAVAFLDQERLFFFASDGTALVSRYLESRSRGARAGSSLPEKGARQGLWGEDGRPLNLLSTIRAMR